MTEQEFEAREAVTPKRFYQHAKAGLSASGGFEIQLDGRSVKTPARAPLILPGRTLADAIAAEWQAQGRKVDPQTMPLMSLACTAFDRVVPRRREVVDEAVRYAETDLLCHRAAEPEELVRRQAETWQPLLDWAARELDAPLKTTTGILATAQPDDSLAALRRAVEGHDDLSLTALSLAVGAAGSLIVGLALLAGRLDSEAAFAAAELDETYQIEVWGEDPDAAKRREARRNDLALASSFYRLLKG